jgi:hypothetical protein
MLLEDQFNQMIETVDGFFGRDKTPNQARAAFREYRDESLKGIPEMPAELLAENAFYAAIAFLGMTQLVEGKELDAFKDKPTAATLQKLVDAGGLNLRRSAVEGWKFLLASHPEAAVTVLALCAMSAGNKVIENALKS